MEKCMKNYIDRQLTIESYRRLMLYLGYILWLALWPTLGFKLRLPMLHAVRSLQSHH